MITTQLRNLLLAVVCIFAGVSAHAQFSGSVDQYPTANYAASPISFKISEIATALGTDAATLGNVLSTYIEAEAPEALFFLPDAAGNETSAPSADANGFWMSASGQRLDYGDGCAFYASPSVDIEADEFAFNVGQMPNVMQAGDVAHATITLKYNGKEVTFTLTLNVIAKPEYEVPEPTVIEKDLQIVGQQEVVIEQFPRGGYDSDVVKVKLGDALSLLGITTPGLLVDDISKVVYTTWYNAGDVAEGGGLKKDSLTNAATAGGHGFWFRPVQNEGGEYYGEVSASGWGDTDKFYLEAFAYSEEDDSLTCNLGQFPGSCKENETWYANIYLIYGQKAYLIKYTLKVLEKEQGNGMSDYTKVGEGAQEVKQEPTNDYSSITLNIDMEAIAAALGCEVSAVGMIALDDKDNFAGSTGERGGFWFSKNGTVIAWGAGAAICLNPVTENDFSKFTVCQYPDALQIGDEVSATLYFVNGTKYYAYTITLKVAEPEFVDYGFESVETRSFAVQALPTTDYAASDLITISAESLMEAIGTAAPTLYGLNIDSVAVVKGTYSNAYSCDPKPGFWLNKDGRVSVWGDSEAFIGISWVDNSIMRFFQHSDRTKAGDVFKTQLFLVNEETNKMITVNITLNIVESLEQKEVVGEENIIIPFGDKEIATEVDLSKAAAALGLEAEDLLNSNNYYLRGMADGAYGEGISAENGLSFAPNGDYYNYGSLYVYFVKEDGKVFMYSGSNDPVATDFHAKAQFCFEYDNKQYVFYATLASLEYIENGIETITVASQRNGFVYDLQGRQVVKPQRGLYIQNGRKVLVRM